MGFSLDQMLEGSEGSTFGVTVVSNEDDGIVSYGQGRLQLFKGVASPVAPRITRDTLRTVGGVDGEGLILLFSDRPVAGSNNPKQPFDANQTEGLAFTITPGWTSGLPATIDMRFVTWGNHHFRLTTTAMSDLLVGIGPALSGKSPNSVFTFSFYEETGPR